MSFRSPAALWLLLVVAGVVAGYLVLERRRAAASARYASAHLLPSVAPRRPGWRRHAVAAASVLTLLSLVLALAQPTRQARVPRDEAVVMLAIDVSGSMAATDVAPSRIQAAVAAAKGFVKQVPARFQIGVVAFETTAHVLASPTSDHQTVLDAIDTLRPGRGTAAGDGIHVALDSIASSLAIDRVGGTKLPASIVLLSDGATTVGRPIEDAAAEAKDAGVPVNTIAFGTDNGFVSVDGQVIQVPTDEAAMATIAEISGGTFFRAATAGQLRNVYKDIQARVGYRVEPREVTRTFVGFAALGLFAAAGASLLWMGRFL